MSIVGCRTIEDAARYSMEFWCRQPGFGPRISDELEEQFSEKGLCYGSDPGPKAKPVSDWISTPRKSNYQEVGSVYFIKPDGIEKVKIGFASTLVKQRLAALQTGSCEILRVIGEIENGSRTLEAELHERFKKDRLHLEWFRLSDAIRDFIKSTHAPA